MFSRFKGAAAGFSPHKLYGFIFHKTAENTGRIRASADACGNGIGQFAGHFQKLFASFNTDNMLKIAHQHRERVRAENRSDTVNGINGVFKIGFKGRINGFFQRF